MTGKAIKAPFSERCRAIGHKSGERCKNKCLAGTMYCHFHTDGWPNQCTAKSKQSGKRCKKKALPGKTVCKFHGGMGGGPLGNKNAAKKRAPEVVG